LINPAYSRFPFILFVVSSLAFSACTKHIKHNFSEGQIVDTVILRTASDQKSWGIVTVYNEVLEGYLLGGIIAPNGEKIQGIEVKVFDELDQEAPEFKSGLTDNDGIYKVPFSLPILWGEIDFQGRIVVPEGWDMITPGARFRIYFDRKEGILVYNQIDQWITVMDSGGLVHSGRDLIKAKRGSNLRGKRRTRRRRKIKKATPKKKGGDFFESLGFEP